MPSSTQGTNGTTPKIGSKNITSRGRFELPVLAPLDSLTAGTNIPPPLPSPVEEPKTEAEAEVKAPKQSFPVAAPTTRDFAPKPAVKDIQNRIVTNNNSAGYIGAFDVRGSIAPTSPKSPSRPSSIRRFLSRKSLHQSYTDNNGSSESLAYQPSRPESPSVLSTTSTRPSLGSKRSSSWFSRFIGGDGERASKRASVLYENENEKQANMGPPPPQLPKLDQLKAKVTDKSVDMDVERMFKNI